MLSSLSQGKRDCGKEWSSGGMCIPLRDAGAVAPGFGGGMHCHVYCQRTCFSGPLLLCFLATLHLLVMPELLFGRVFLRLWSEGVYGLIPSRTTKCQYVLYPYCIPTQHIWSSGGKCSHKELKSLRKTPSIRQAGNMHYDSSQDSVGSARSQNRNSMIKIFTVGHRNNL